MANAEAESSTGGGIPGLGVVRNGSALAKELVEQAAQRRSRRLSGDGQGLSNGAEGPASAGSRSGTSTPVVDGQNGSNTNTNSSPGERSKGKKRAREGDDADAPASLRTRRDRPHDASTDAGLVAEASPSEAYLASAAAPSRTLSPSEAAERRLLVVVDLNETLLFRIRPPWIVPWLEAPGGPPKSIYVPFRVKRRPYVEVLLAYLAKTGCEVLVWSSATEKNVMKLAQTLGWGNGRWADEARRAMVGDDGDPERDLPKLKGIWHRAHMGLTAQDYGKNVQTRKDLAKVWDKAKKQGWGDWSEHNTVLIDNDAAKAALQPYNHIMVDDFAYTSLKTDEALLGVIGKLDVLLHRSSVASSIKDGLLSSPPDVHPTAADGTLSEPAEASDATPSSPETSADRWTALGTAALERHSLSASKGSLERVWVDGAQMDEEEDVSFDYEKGDLPDEVREYYERLGAPVNGPAPDPQVKDGPRPQ